MCVVGKFKRKLGWKNSTFRKKACAQAQNLKEGSLDQDTDSSTTDEGSRGDAAMCFQHPDRQQLPSLPNKHAVACTEQKQ